MIKHLDTENRQHMFNNKQRQTLLIVHSGSDMSLLLPYQ